MSVPGNGKALGIRYEPMHPCPTNEQTEQSDNYIRQAECYGKSKLRRRIYKRCSSLTPLRELASSHPKRESPAMAQATADWLRVEEVIT